MRAAVIRLEIRSGCQRSLRICWCAKRRANSRYPACLRIELSSKPVKVYQEVDAKRSASILLSKEAATTTLRAKMVNGKEPNCCVSSLVDLELFLRCTTRLQEMLFIARRAGTGNSRVQRTMVSSVKTARALTQIKRFANAAQKGRGRTETKRFVKYVEI